MTIDSAIAAPLSWSEIFKAAVVSLPVIPTLILFVLLLFVFVLVGKAQSRDDFDFGDMLKDENGKVSSTRMFSFICLAVTSWIIAVLTISDKLTSEYFWYYLVIWSGTAVALKLVDKWNGTLPFSRNDMRQAVQAGADAAAAGANAVQAPIIVAPPASIQPAPQPGPPGPPGPPADDAGPPPGSIVPPPAGS